MALVTCNKVGNALTEWLIDADQTDKDALCDVWPCTAEVPWTYEENSTATGVYTITAADHHKSIKFTNAGLTSIDVSNVPEGVEFSIVGAPTTGSPDYAAIINGAAGSGGNPYGSGELFSFPNVTYSSIFHAIGPSGGGPAVVLSGEFRPAEA